MISLANQLEMIRPQLNLRTSQPETLTPGAVKTAPVQPAPRIPAKVMRDGVSWSPTCWYNPKSSHDRQRAMRYLQESLRYGASIDPTSRWSIQVGNSSFRMRDEAEVTAWINY